MRYFDNRKILIVGENNSAKAISAVPRTFFGHTGTGTLTKVL